MPSEASTAGVVDELKRELERRTRELAEAREQQTATAGILAALSSSPADLRHVCAEIAANAARLCDAYDAAILQVEGNNLKVVAHHGPISAALTVPLTRGVISGRAVLDRRMIHVGDLQAEGYEFVEGKDYALRFGYRTILAVPLMHQGKAIGAISVRRSEVRPFDDHQIELLKTFADQAVIAIENSRLFHETKEALERQTATANILQIISSSPTDVNPVFEAILENACRLCDSQLAAVFRFDGRLLHIVATKNWSKEVLASVANLWPMPPDQRTVSG